MALMPLRSRSRVKASMVLTRADHLFIHNYVRSLLNNILRPMGYPMHFIKLINGSNEGRTAKTRVELPNDCISSHFT